MRRDTSSMEPLLNVTNVGDIDVGELQKEKIVAKVDIHYSRLIS